MDWRGWLRPHPESPLPSGAVFSIIFVAVFLSHFVLLRLPYYWDEAGYYIPAAYDFFRSGSPIPYSTLTNAHPPLPSIYLALWWKASGYTPAVTRTAMCVIAALALTAVWRMARTLDGTPSVAAWTLVLTGLYPVWFAQSTLAHADLVAAAATLWGLLFALPGKERRPWAAAICFSLAALAKETSIVTPIALAACELWWASKKKVGAASADREAARQSVRAALWFLFCLVPLAAWYAYHRIRTGFVFGNPEYVRYNATSTLTPLRFVLALGHRVLHLTAHMNMFVPVLCALATLVLDPLQDRLSRSQDRLSRSHKGQAPKSRIGRRSLTTLAVILIANAIAFSVLGGALLTRYLLPMYPLVILVCVSTMHARVRYWHALTVFAAGAFLAALFLNPPYRFAPEDNLAYRDVIRLHQRAIGTIVTRFPNSTVLTAWPVSDELQRPELGYVKRPIKTVSIDNFTLPEIEKAAAEPGLYNAALVFSTKYDPPHLPLTLGKQSEVFDERYFGLHHDLSPGTIAQILNGHLEWQAERDNQWAAVLHFDRAIEATLTNR